MVSVFVSYSHRDEDLRNELEVHLSALKRRGEVSVWHDRRITGGKELGDEINENLLAADVVLLLVSPYFIASNYCFDVEMEKAMERHESGEARVVPVILHPCDWMDLPFGKLMATPTDGKPVSKHANIHDAFLDVTKSIKAIASEMNAGNEDGSDQPVLREVFPFQQEPAEQMVVGKRSSNLRIKKNFSDFEKDEFLVGAYSIVCEYFENSLKELEARNSDIKTSFRMSKGDGFVAIIYRNGDEASCCTVWNAGRGGFPAGVVFSYGNKLERNSYNESLSVEDDGYVLYLSPMGLMGDGNSKLSMEGGAELYWGRLIEHLR